MNEHHKKLGYIIACGNYGMGLCLRDEAPRLWKRNVICPPIKNP